MKETPSAGKWGEELAVSFLSEKGYIIDERNWHSGRDGEIDIIARDGPIIVFIEVKTRFSEKYGQPVQAVGISKQRQIGRLAKKYLYLKDLYGKADCRFDVVAIKFTGGKKIIEHIEDAFRINPR
ncbi:MAG: YraN family protein [Candidatus Edwardsbacteria bacterium RIFOXYD12_FULL_50_11]|jgi:putative endonuclease|nr:MAG: YraN family protein [Candidatus Edwardsbacteria bacterium RifOxyC12_full_54_24]OGF07959.1 MAG: YraN family protein [Candidatus Edwardsbacteria bacterium RifOxyA12_full_54_48]OGF10207.1 MAG: YraN family protein [Candidatus Edwardsbacteria bacterium GWE2_54_12]OGF15119.1 MAG: YraN family protein [Candidatus Edwardsbacteria bacterium RIFOXYD12_FULL_50_11]OGJ19101.1 MAG: YraN family protein [Candidatus Edwardsbacteria bacterium RifOxyB12_full_52_30]HAD81066.1 YraN family protein [Candidatu